MKPQVANDYFASVIDMPNDGTPVEYSGDSQYAPDQEQPQEQTDETD